MGNSPLGNCFHTLNTRHNLGTRGWGDADIPLVMVQASGGTGLEVSSRQGLSTTSRGVFALGYERIGGGIHFRPGSQHEE